MKPTLPPRPEPPPRPRWSPSEYLDNISNSVPFHLQHAAMSALPTVQREWYEFQCCVESWRGKVAEWQEQCRLCEAGGAGKVGNARSRKTL